MRSTGLSVGETAATSDYLSFSTSVLRVGLDFTGTQFVKMT